jgi:hypothetical protein
VEVIHPTNDPERPMIMPRCSRDMALICSCALSMYGVEVIISRAAREPVLALSTLGDKLFTTATDRELMQDPDRLSRG